MTNIVNIQDKTANAIPTSPALPEPLTLRKRIGSTTFTVNVRFSSTATETLEDKIHRLIEREAA